MTEALTGAPPLKDFKDIPPPTFLEEKGGRYMLSQLSQRPLWQERPVENGRPDTILFLNLQSDRKYTFDGKTLVTTELDDILNHGEGFNGVVLVTGSMNEGDSSVTRNIIAGMSSLKPGGSVFIFEKPEGKLEKPKDFVEKEWRENALKEMGLVEVNVLNSGRKVPGSILWEAHMPREGGLKNPIDLLEDGPYYIDGMIGDMKERYISQGWNVVDFDNSELAKKLRKSKFPLKDIHSIRDGFGVKVKSNQCPTATCEGVIPIDTGNLELTNSCGEEHFQPTPTDVDDIGERQDSNKTAVQPVKKHKDGETEILNDRSCIYCGDHLQAYYFREGKGPQQVQISCPHDGFVELKTA